MPMRSVHRIVTLAVVLFTLYLGCTGTLIQLIDMRSLFTHAPAADPNVMAMREAFDGPGAYQVIATADHTAQPLPADADFDAMFAATVRGAHAALGDAPLRFVEVRMVDGRPIGQVRSAKPVLRFDPLTGAALGPAPPVRDDSHPASQRNTVKELHRMTTFGDNALWINVFVSICLGTLIVTGLVMYWRLLQGRMAIGRKGLFWKAGGWWKSLHRWTSIVAALFLVVTTLSGAWLAVESLIFGYYMTAQHKLPPRPRIDPSAPLKDAELPAMLHTTLTAYHQAMPGVAIRVVRLRYFGGMPQGAVISDGEVAKQLVFNAVTGRRVSTSEPGYPVTGFPFGWRAHQIAKSIHRGDYIGMPGRFTDLIAGLSMIYLSVSGIVMYWDLWSKRRKAGRKGLVWT